MKLYGFLASPYVARIVMLARLKGIPLEALPPPGGGIKSPEYLALNPIGKMPALEDGGESLAESTIIMEYVEHKYPQKPTLPADPMQRARAHLLGRIFDLYVSPQVGVFFRNMNPATRNETEVATGKQGLQKTLGDLQHFMGNGPYAIGSALGYADCVILPPLLMTGMVVAGFGVTNIYEGLPKLSAWAQRMQQDPLAGPFSKEYRDALGAFIGGRRG